MWWLAKKNKREGNGGHNKEQFDLSNKAIPQCFTYKFG